MRRVIASAVASAVALVALGGPGAAGAGAAGATYQVLKCHSEYHGSDELSPSIRGPYSAQDRCTGEDRRLQVLNHGAAVGGQGAQWQLTAPPGTTIAGLSISANLLRDNHHWAQIQVQDDQGAISTLLNGGGTDPGWERHSFAGLDDRHLIVTLRCTEPTCERTDRAHAYVRGIELLLRDQVSPVIGGVGGSLFAPGWLRRGHDFIASVTDVGAGAQQITARVNGQAVGQASGACTLAGLTPPNTPVLVPCGGVPPLSLNVDTAALPFRNGSNAVEIAAFDFSGNPATPVVRTVLIDNAPPSLAFRDTPDPGDPELIRAPVYDAHSGVTSGGIEMRRVGAALWQPLETVLSGGELRARVDSSLLPPGQYELRAHASDVAGNQRVSDLREDGTRMLLRFPLRAATGLTAGIGEGGGEELTVPYATSSSVTGRLTDAAGEPLVGEEVVVEEYFGEGALIDRRVRTVTTGTGGRWTSSIPAGPSREISASFAGTSSHLPTGAEAGELTVRSYASFDTERRSVPEGSRVVFRGQVGRLGARIPDGGKLIELQVKESRGRWNTVREAFHTNPGGRYALAYRFGRFYQADAVFTFRVKVAREQGWPYEAPVRSRQRKLTVRAR